MPLLAPGTKIRGTYEVERFLGEGAFAEVYRVKHRFLGRQAMKVFKTRGMTADETVDLLGEAILLSRIGHPNIVRVFEANTLENAQGEWGFFTMEYVAGGTLERYWESHGGAFVAVEDSVEVLVQACRGIAVAHTESPPIIHRDIKPQNLLVGYGPAGLHVRVSDFGLAKAVNPMTMQASAKGTLAFKAPEALVDVRADSSAGDVWALGVTLYLLLTDDLPDHAPPAGRPPKPLTPPSQRNILVNTALDRIVARALAVDPKSRYADAAALLKDLQAWQRSAEGPDQARTTRREEPLATEPLGSGELSPAEEAARIAVARALELAQVPGRLPEAADLLEDTLNRHPSLRGRHAYRLSLWRRGVVS